MPRENYSPCVLVDTADLPEDDWLEWRRKGIGGSDAAAILGISPFATARDIYYDKLNILAFEENDDNWVQKQNRIYQLEISDGKVIPFVLDGIQYLHKAG